jgi:PhzF family phenazine biosynthesis protein
MTDIPVYQVDAFSGAVFGGNPAAICPLETWLPDATLQDIAAENNLSETAFFVPDGAGYRLRWFTPTVEVDLCGHATLASAYVILTRLDPSADAVRFETRSGTLTVTRDGDRLTMDFPSIPGEPADPPDALVRAVGRRPEAVAAGPNVLALLGSAAEVRDLAPDMAAVAELHPRCLIVTAPGDDCDFVSRFFAPSYGIPEDPVTGSAHCMLTPFWAARLGKTALHARQISARGGELWCEAAGDRVRIGGRAALFLEGRISI